MPGKTASTSMVSEETVRVRAYLLWEADGRPDGMAEHYWHLASAEPAAPAKAKRVKRAAADAPEPSRKGKAEAKAKAGKAAPRAKASKAKS